MAKRQATTQARIVRDADDHIYTTAQVLERIPVNRATLWRMSREGRFPKPIQLTPARIGWRRSAVLAWLEDRERRPIEPRRYFGRDKEADDAR